MFQKNSARIFIGKQNCPTHTKIKFTMSKTQFKKKSSVQKSKTQNIKWKYNPNEEKKPSVKTDLEYGTGQRISRH